MKAHRIYIIGNGQDIRLVRATHRAQALAHVAKSSFTVQVANQDQLVAALTGGVKVESANDGETAELFEDAEQAQTAAA